MRFVKLEPEFLRNDGETVESINAAHGVMFLCPKCFTLKGGPVGVHQICCWCPGAPGVAGARWELKGTGFSDLSLVGGSSSVRIIGGCAAHFFVTAGKIEFCSDCFTAEDKRPMTDLAEGQHVKFYGTHDKSHQFTGTIVRVHEDSDLVDISAEPDGKAIEVETVLTAHSSDVTPIEE